MSLPQADSPAPKSARNAWALAVSAGRGVLVSRDGEVEDATPRSLNARLAGDGLLTVHAPFVWRRLGGRAPPRSAGLFDLAELFAFVHPARFAVPTTAGLASVIGLDAPSSAEEEAALLHSLTDRLLADLATLQGDDKEDAASAAMYMARAGWSWAGEAIAALGIVPGARAPGFEPWRRLPEWEETPPHPEPGLQPVLPEEARTSLQGLLSRALDANAREVRSAQADYAEAASHIFEPREDEGEPHMVLAEAGTGIGKTLGYLAPSAVWARRNDGTVWISTYTKNLQRQIAQTLARVRETGNGSTAPLRTVVRKGRENYICLLNLQQAAMGLFDGVGIGLVGRWLRHTKDGDMVGGDFPAWLAPLIGRGGAERVESLGLTDRRGECIYGACAHYRRCFIERVQRSSEEAELVIANHALVLIRAAGDAALTEEMKRRPMTRLVLDEGHHLFDAADSAFSAHLTAMEMADLRRWIRGYEERGGRRRGRTLVDRLSELIGDDQESEELLGAALRAAHVLPSELWRRRLREGAEGPAYAFLAAIEAQVAARTTRNENEFALECPVHPAQDEVLKTGAELADLLSTLGTRLGALARRLGQRLVDEADELETGTRGRLESVIRSLMIRTENTLPAWIQMLKGLESETPVGFVDWFSAARRIAHEGDIGMHRHYVDPTRPLADSLYKPAHGVLVTSATLFDSGVGEEDGVKRHDRTGASHLTHAPTLLRFPSPFPYAEATKFIVVRDVDIRDIDHLAAAMRALFEASGGGALGLFNAVSRLRAVHKRIAAPLEGKGLPLYAQHIDEMDTGTLVDIFRFETDSCLLGTDAVRDGVDVPGRSLRLIVLERVPWPRPDILHKARREALGGRAYEEEIVRRRIAQGFGRLIRRDGDKGVFVLLGAQTPSRLMADLPEGVEVIRTGLAEAARQVHTFVG